MLSAYELTAAGSQAKTKIASERITGHDENFRKQRMGNGQGGRTQWVNPFQEVAES